MMLNGGEGAAPANPWACPCHACLAVADRDRAAGDGRQAVEGE